MGERALIHKKTELIKDLMRKYKKVDQTVVIGCRALADKCPDWHHFTQQVFLYTFLPPFLFLFHLHVPHGFTKLCSFLHPPNLGPLGLQSHQLQVSFLLEVVPVAC